MRVYPRNTVILFFLAGIISLHAQDTDIPLAPVLDLVTVDPFTGHTSLYWTPSASPDVAGYIIYRLINNEGYAIDTVFSPYVNSYINTWPYAAFFSEKYVLNAFDSTYYDDPQDPNTSPFSNSLNTIYLKAAIDSCRHRIELSWNAYLTDSPTVDEYRVYYSRDGSDYQIKGTTADTSFSIESFESYSEYCFYAEALLSNGTSSLSNLFCIDTDIPAPPGWINADYASFNDDGTVSLAFTIDPTSELHEFRIERSTASLHDQEVIYEGTHNEEHIEYIDHDPPEGINYYRMSALNNCDEAVIFSNYSSTIKLNISKENDLIHLQWNGYYDWLGGVSNYSILRNNRGFFEEIATLGGNDTSYTDNIRDFLYETDHEDICYRIIAEEGSNPYITNASSTSVTKCVEQPVNVFVPNAFTPDNNNLNEIFKPVISFTPIDYILVIKNRSGKTLFETNDHLQGWDGRYGSEMMPQDVYIWFLKLETPGGKTISKTGTVTVIFNENSIL